MDSSKPFRNYPLQDSPAEESLDYYSLAKAFPPPPSPTYPPAHKDHEYHQIFLNIKITAFPTTPLDGDIGSYRALTGVRELDGTSWRVPDKAGALISRSMYGNSTHDETKNWVRLEREDAAGLTTVVDELMKEVAYTGWELIAVRSAGYPYAVRIWMVKVA